MSEPSIINDQEPPLGGRGASCAIIISHYESLHFLHTCIRQIRKHAHPDIEQLIVIADQSGDQTGAEIQNRYAESHDIRIVRMQPLYSGYGIDHIMQVDTNMICRSFGAERRLPDYICQLHVDAFPIHNNWLHLPVKLMQENNFTFVGQLHFIANGTEGIYPPDSRFFSMSPTFNIGTYQAYKEMSEQAGFTRFHARPNIDMPISFANNDWDNWAAADYQARGSDDDTVAFYWQDKYRQHNKLGLAITGMMGQPGEAGFGRIIDDLVFHFGFCRESIGVGEAMGRNYIYWSERIKQGFDDALLAEMLTVANAGGVNGQHASLTRNVWDGTQKTYGPPNAELNEKIENLKI